ncbi:hypothetical protein ACFQ02_08145 [Seminibacterium arietis]|uniref:Uncharacterized protein n=1 Tax=Seminibacterium arietis TaxID=1173502 RepID=A0ABW3IA87_9PAST
MASQIISKEKALVLTTLWLNTLYDNGRHQKRLEMIEQLSVP